MRDFRRLDVWHESIAMARHAYEATQAFPSSERYGLTAQMRSAAVSVSSNIAEGAGRHSPTDNARFLTIAVGSTCELDSQIEVAIALGYLPGDTPLLPEVDLLRRRLTRLHSRIATSPSRPQA